MANSNTPSLRLWPGLAGITLLLFARFGLKALFPGFEGFKYAIFGMLGSAALLIVWWLFFSRARWIDRVGGLGLIAGGLGGAWIFKHESMSVPWIVAYALPLTLCVFVGMIAITGGKSSAGARVVVAAAILVSSLGWLLARTEGIDGDHNSQFAWRSTATAEERLLAKLPPAPPPPPAAEPRPDPQQKSEKAVPTPIVPAEWPGFRGPRRDSVVRGIQVDTNWTEKPPVELWRKPIGPGWSSFAVQGGLIFTQEQQGEEEAVSAYRAESGELAWRHADRVRFFESNAGAGPRATPQLANGRVYTLGATGVLNVLDAATGQRVWTRNTTEDTKRRVPEWGFSASPIVTQGLVIVFAGRLAAYDASSGQLKWLSPSGGGSYSSPHLARIGGVEQVLIQTPQGTAGFDPLTGKQNWSHEWRGLPIIQPTVLPGDGVLISATQSEGTRLIEPIVGPAGWTVNTRWTSLNLKPYFNDTIVHKDHAYGFDNRILACIDLAEGKRAWKGGRYGNGQMLLLPDQDLLLVLSEDGELALVNASPAGFTETAKLKVLEGKTWNHPAIAAGVLYVRNSEEMAAFRLSRPSSPPNAGTPSATFAASRLDTRSPSSSLSQH